MIEPEVGDVVEPEAGDVVEPEAGDVIEPEAGDVIEPKAGDVVEPEAGDVVEPEAGDVAEPEAGDVVEPEAGDIVEPEAGDVAEPEAGDVVEPEAGDVVEPEAGDVVEPEAGDVVEPEAGVEAGSEAGSEAGAEAGAEAGSPVEPEMSAYNLCGIGADQPRASGTISDPITAPYSPFLDRNDTTATIQDLYDSYDCAPDRREYGREVVYQFTLPSESYFRAEVTDPQGVDIDLHLLRNPTVNAEGLVTGCLDRNDRIIKRERLAAGTYYLVADSWTNASGFEYEGEYTVAFEWLPYEEWIEAPLASGVTLKRRLGQVQGAQKLVHVVVASANTPVAPRRHSGCSTVNSELDRAGALVGINANFFVASQGCDPTDFLRVNQQTLSLNETTMFAQRTMGWTSSGETRFSWVGYQSDWTDVMHGVGGYPSLVINRQVAVEVEPGVQVYSATDWSDQPRSAVGVTEGGDLIFAVVDGRNSMSSGLFNQTWAEWLHDQLELREAIGLDGGGSSTLSVRDCWLNDVVSFPSDGGGVNHGGARAVGSGLYLTP